MSVQIGLLVIALACIGICYVVAKKRGAKVSFWVLMSVLFGPLAVPFVFFSKPVATYNPDAESATGDENQ